MRPGRSILILALAAAAGAYEIANPGFDARDGGRPDGWMTYGWGRPVAGILAESVDDADGRCLRLGATAEGSAGVISSPIALAEPAALRIRLRLRPSADYAGNRPWVFLSAHRGGAFLDQTGVPLPALPAGTWTMVDVVVPADRLPAGLEMVRLNIATQRHAAADAPAAGHLDADDIAISEDRSAPTVAIACDRFASWSVAGQPVSFRIASGGLGRRARQVAVRVVDSLGAAVADQTVAATTFAAEGWTWTPPGPGFYDIYFTAGIEREGRIEAVPLTQSYAVRAPSRRDLAFTRDRWSLAVAAAPTRPMPERSPLFGFSYQLGLEDEVRLADLIGLSFARIHAIPWGSQFSDVRRAIEPERGVYRWDELDEKVGWLHARGYAMVGNVLYTPQWASPHPEDTKVDICVPGFAAWAPRDLGDWTRFLEKLVERYGDRISTWELWNEPHLPGGSCFWHDTPERFVAMLQAGYDTLKRVQPGCEVWIGGIGMRYVPFYRQLARLGGLSAFDRLALHGSWCDPAPFHAIERAAGAQPKPWANSEQHGILLNPGAEIPSERALARRLVLDSFGQLARGAQRLALFQIPEYMDAEVLPAARAEGWFIHSSGLFRARPRVEPRLPALVWHTVIAEVRPGMAIRSQHRLGDVRVLALGGGGDAGGDLLLAWSDAAAALPEQLARIAAGAAVIDWEGRPRSE
ncbi:MAG: hypothetical protein J0M02_16165, partial [Planctomycetes bacterium]|nr:hypothetical protein [Planctomycetota bacterium]